MSRNTARLRILNWITQFALYRLLPSGGVFHPGGDQAFRMLADGFAGTQSELPAVGSLVAIQSAPATKWYLSWVHAVIPGETRFDAVYVLESIEDGDLCEWRNISLLVFAPKTVAEHPEWRWTDAQFEFHRRWHRALSDHGPALMRTVYGVFNDDGSAEVRARKSLSDDPHIVRAVPDWAAATDEDLVVLAKSIGE